MRLNKSDLAILIKNTEGVSFSFEDDANGLSTVELVNKRSFEVVLEGNLLQLI